VPGAGARHDAPEGGVPSLSGKGELTRFADFRRGATWLAGEPGQAVVIGK